MSATNRGSERQDGDLYETPPQAIDPVLPCIDINHYKKILEPTAGNGSIIRQIRKASKTKQHITAVEINREMALPLIKLADNTYITDYRKFSPSENYDLIITNPAFSIALEILEHSFEISAGKADIVMLLRQGFFSSESRRDFWKRHELRKYFPLINRPSFGKNYVCSKKCGWKHFVPNSSTDVYGACPKCGSGVKTTSNDATDYAWYVFSNRPKVLFPVEIKPI